MNTPRRSRGITLIETVIVLLVLGIIAAVTAPTLLDTEATREESHTRRNLALLRNAIDMYHTRTGAFPAESELPNAMATILTGAFPAPSIGSATQDTGVYYDLDMDVDTPATADPLRDGGWVYKPANGSLKLNLDASERGADW